MFVLYGEMWRSLYYRGNEKSLKSLCIAGTLWYEHFFLWVEEHSGMMHLLICFRLRRNNHTFFTIYISYNCFIALPKTNTQYAFSLSKHDEDYLLCSQNRYDTVLLWQRCVPFLHKICVCCSNLICHFFYLTNHNNI